MSLGPMEEYGIGHTPLLQARNFLKGDNLWLKIESRNPTGSIKDRLAYYMVCQAESSGSDPTVRLVDSTSGNFGLAMMRMARIANREFVALVDPTIAPEKLSRLVRGGNVRLVENTDALDFRAARIAEARRLSGHAGWRWTNQYDNPAGFLAHYETTGPEIWEQTEGHVTAVVCSVGTGGTICGIGHFLKRCDPSIRVVAVEPEGSTVFGGVAHDYLNVGAGMSEPSGILRRYGQVIDAFCKIPDEIALQICCEFRQAEGEGVGVTTGAAVFLGAHLARANSAEVVVVVAPDGWENYSHLATQPPMPGPLPVPEIFAIEGRLITIDADQPCSYGW